LKEAFLTFGTLLLFIGCMGAIAGTTAMGAGANITPQALQQLLMWEVIWTILAFIGAALVLRNR
jgi:hypothetical protein